MANGADGRVVIDTALDSAGFQRGSKKLDSAIASLVGTVDRMGDKLKAGFKNNAQVEAFQMGIERIRGSVELLSRDVVRANEEAASTPAFATLTASIREAKAELEGLHGQMEGLIERGVNESSAEWTTLAKEIRDAEMFLQRYQEGAEKLRATGNAFTAGIDTEQTRQQTLAIETLRSTLERLSEGAVEAGEALASTQSSGEELKATTNPLVNIFLKLKAVLIGIVVTVVKVTAAVAKMVVKGAIIGFKKLTTAIGGFIRKGKQGQNTANGLVKSLTSLKTMLTSRIKRMFISQIINGVQSAMQSLAKYSSGFNASMSSMKNSMTGLSGNIAVTFGGIVNAVAPAITTIIDLISRAISYINAFFALLSGKSSVTVAKKQTDGYAKSLGGAASAAKELKEQVYGFDDLNKASSASDSSGGGGGGGGAGGDLFEEVGIDSLLPDSVASFFDALKAAFDAGDWEGIGMIVAGGLNAIVTSVDNWITSVRPVAVTWASNIARILNGLVGEFDWYAMGGTVGNGLNTVFDVVHTFLTTFDFNALGVGLGKGFNGLFDRVNFALMGKTFASRWNALINMIKGFVQTVDWIGIGLSIAFFVNNWFSTIDWIALGMMVSDGFLGLLAAINTFLAATDWQQIGRDIAAFLAAIDWGGLVVALAKGVGGAFGALEAIVAGLIEDALFAIMDYFTHHIEAAGGDIVGGLLDGIVFGLANIATWIWDNVFKPFIDGFKAAFGINSPSTVMKEQGGYLIDGLLGGLKATWDSITEWFGNILGSLGTLLSGAWDGIKSTATTAWTNIKTAVMNTVTQTWEAVKGTAESIQTGLSSAWDSVKSTAATTWDTIKTSVSDAVSNAWTSVKGTAETIKSGLSTSWNSIKTTASKTWTSTSTWISDTWKGLKTTLGKIDWTGIGDGVLSGAKKGISDGWNSVSSWVTSKFSSLVSGVKKVFGIHSPSTVFAEIGEFLMEGLNIGLEDEQGTVMRTIDDISESIVDTMENAPDIEFSANAVATGIDTAADKLSRVASVFTAIADALASMGGLKIPAIAAGTVAPYKTRVSGGTSESADPMASFTSNFDETMSDQRDLLRELIEVVRRLRLTVDGDSLTSTIASIRRSQERSFGGV